MDDKCRCLFKHPDTEEEKELLTRQLEETEPDHFMYYVLQQQLEPCWTRKEEKS